MVLLRTTGSSRKGWNVEHPHVCPTVADEDHSPAAKQFFPSIPGSSTEWDNPRPSLVRGFLHFWFFTCRKGWRHRQRGRPFRSAVRISVGGTGSVVQSTLYTVSESQDFPCIIP